MKRFIFSLGIVFTVVACQIDNYEAPNAGIDGKLIDVETGEVVYTEQPDGCKISLIEQGYEAPVPLYFWVKPDGSFRNVALFSGTYKVVPVEGPIFPCQEEIVELNKITTHNFNVTPFLRITVENIEYGETESGKISVKFRVKRATPPDGMTIGSKTIYEACVIVNDKPVVSYYNNGNIDSLKVLRNFSRSKDETVENTLYTADLTKLISGKKYYIRLAALSSCSYNSTLKRDIIIHKYMK